MKKIIFMFVLLFAPLIVKAECSTDEVIRLKSLASKISITYDYTEKNGYISFSATFHNVHKDLKLIDVTNKEYSSNEEFSDVKIDNLNFSGTYYVNIVSKLQNCKNELMLKKYYTVPYYNPYSSDELCKGNETKTVWSHRYRFRAESEGPVYRGDGRSGLSVRFTDRTEQTSDADSGGHSDLGARAQPIAQGT